MISLVLLQEEYDTHDPKEHCAITLPFLKKRSRIIEIVAAHDIVFALARSGVCAAFSRGKMIIILINRYLACSPLLYMYVHMHIYGAYFFFFFMVQRPTRGYVS